jgi:hypothetical protein
VLYKWRLCAIPHTMASIFFGFQIPPSYPDFTASLHKPLHAITWNGRRVNVKVVERFKARTMSLNSSKPYLQGGEKAVREPGLLLPSHIPLVGKTVVKG